ncbi:glycosyltransferase family 4 protein [Urbifossiella limnaea]|uniref:D-inositol 3-phosphate glycosyltransferase n=1 Tax=Urbifossiella limnaea TaxID=2528023 RepID=A0A517XY23_9BACT|nr:glycosyltransferase family 4 protein [Urbifossiella limnaea]QDU22394.1 D-inositol 3-phosphate glycosyltransferase [Urbifossiella limnaea]
MLVPDDNAPLAGLRVAFLTHYTELYGANLSMLNLLDGLVRAGVRPHVVCPEGGDLLGVLAERAVPAAVVPFEWWVSPARTVLGAATRIVRNLRRVRAIARQVRTWGCGLVYSNSSVFAAGALAAAELELPHLWHLREFGRRDYDLKPDLGVRLSRLGFRTADATIFVSHALRRAFLGRVTPANSHVIYNGVAREEQFDERRRAAEAVRGRSQPFTFVLVGRFRESKGQDVAIRAVARVPGTRLLLVGGSGQTGDQAYYEQCRTLVAELGVADRVEFWGYIPDPERAFLAADVALMCSRSEAMGRVTAEAMSACRPVIGYDAGGTSELIDAGRTGALYRGGADELAECMARYAAAPELAWQHGEAGWNVARRRHSTESYVAQVMDVIRGVVAR